MTDNEIIKALVCCTPTYEKVCGKCIYREYKSHGISEKQCSEYMREDLFNLIFRQKAEIERLQKNLSNLAASMEKCECSKIAMIEAIKEFTKKIEDTTWYSINSEGELVEGANGESDVPLYKADDILKIVKEMVGDNDA